MFSKHLRLVAVLALSALASIASACPATPPLPSVSGGWEPFEPVNVAEKATFTVQWVAGMDVGDPFASLHCYKFTNSPPTYLPYIYAQEMVTFEKLYSHRLSASYSLFDLLKDDQKVRHQFRDYVVAGRLDMNLAEDDAAAIAKHLQAIVDALFTGEEFKSVDGYEYADGHLISEWLKPADEPPQVLPEPPAEQPADCFETWLRQCLKMSNLLKCLHDEGIYHNDQFLDIPDFDCDDFAWAAMNWLRRTLLVTQPDANVFIQSVCWTCPDGEVNCHAVLRIEVHGMMYFYDPMTGNMVGPYSIGTFLTRDEILAILKKLMTQVGVCPGADHWTNPNLTKPWHWYDPSIPENPPFDRPLCEPGPWAGGCLDPETAWNLFVEKLALCCSIYGPIPGPSFPNCPPLTNPLSTWPDPCDPLNYTEPCD